MDEMKEKNDHILTDREIEKKYGRKYAALDLFPEDRKSQVIPALFSALGACIGILPGCMIWVFLGRRGVMAAYVGIIMAGGAFWCGKRAAWAAGYKGFNIIQKAACALVIAVAAYITARYVVVVRMTDIIRDYVPEFRQDWADQLKERGFTPGQINDICTMEESKKYVCESYGIKEISRHECSERFSQLIETCHMKKEYIKYILVSYVTAFGGIILPEEKKSEKERLL